MTLLMYLVIYLVKELKAFNYLHTFPIYSFIPLGLPQFGVPVLQHNQHRGSSGPRCDYTRHGFYSPKVA